MEPHLSNSVLNFEFPTRPDLHNLEIAARSSIPRSAVKQFETIVREESERPLRKINTALE